MFRPARCLGNPRLPTIAPTENPRPRNSEKYHGFLPFLLFLPLKSGRAPAGRSGGLDTPLTPPAPCPTPVPLGKSLHWPLFPHLQIESKRQYLIPLSLRKAALSNFCSFNTSFKSNRINLLFALCWRGGKPRFPEELLPARFIPIMFSYLIRQSCDRLHFTDRETEAGDRVIRDTVKVSSLLVYSLRYSLSIYSEPGPVRGRRHGLRQNQPRGSLRRDKWCLPGSCSARCYDTVTCVP